MGIKVRDEYEEDPEYMPTLRDLRTAWQGQFYPRAREAQGRAFDRTIEAVRQGTERER